MSNRGKSMKSIQGLQQANSDRKLSRIKKELETLTPAEKEKLFSECFYLFVDKQMSTENRYTTVLNIIKTYLRRREIIFSFDFFSKLMLHQIDLAAKGERSAELMRLELQKLFDSHVVLREKLLGKSLRG